MNVVTRSLRGTAVATLEGGDTAELGDPQRPVVRLTEVVKVYREGQVELTALAGVSLDLPRGAFNMIVGPSGSGKTTLLNLIGCIDGATSGRVEVCGCDVGQLADRALTRFRAKRIGFIFQSFNLNPVLSAYENVEYPLLLLGLDRRLRRERTMAMLDAVGLADHARHRPSQLSGGQKQRVAIARALVKAPEIVLADEPTANLDSRTGETIITLMRRIQRDHAATFVFSTHDPQLISHAEHTVRVRDGRVVSVEECEEL
jgi:putative ABC transport system ATP-binding protein